jgi:uncharacterized repeat protein (TIGR03803 family)
MLAIGGFIRRQTECGLLTKFIRRARMFKNTADVWFTPGCGYLPQGTHGRFYGTSAIAMVLAILAVILLLSITPAMAQTETVLFSFGAPPAPSRGGTWPSGGLVFDSKGNLYGSTVYGGHSDNCEGGDGQTSCGVAFQLTPKAGGSWAEKVLHTFSNNGTDGTYPGGMIFDAVGNLYGTTGAGGPYGDGIPFFGGIAFELSPAAGGTWTEKILYDFGGGDVGYSPGSPLIFDAAGNLYGSTFSGGSSVGVHGLGCGSVFELTPGAGGTWTASSLHTFMDEDDGCGPGSLIRNAEGDLFGAADYGKFGYGVVFELTPGSGGVWTDVFLKSFGNDGPDNPNNLVFGSDGSVYAAACNGQGSHGLYKYGSVVEFTPSTGGTWTYSVLYTFTGTSDGTCPGGLVFDASGNLYGVTAGGGTDNYGTVFELTPGVDGIWTKTILHSFAGGSDGSYPDGLTLATSGDLYGTTSSGGVYNGGTVFKIVP